MKRLVHGAVAASAMALASAPALAFDVKVGSAGGVTGPIAELVAAIMKGRMVAADHINGSGGVLEGGTLRMVVGDSACDPKAAVDAGKQARQRRAGRRDRRPELLRGHQRHGAVGDHPGERGGPVRLGDGAVDLRAQGQRHGVPRRALGPYQGLAIAELVSKAGIKKVAMTYSNDDYNAGIAQVFEREFKRMGGTITATRPTSRTRRRTVPSSPPSPRAARRRSPSSPTTARAGSPSSRTAWRTACSTSSTPPTACSTPP